MLKKVLGILFLAFFAASMINNASALVFFSDGFESRSFSKWSGIVTTLGETASVSYMRIRHHGFCSARFTSNGDGVLLYPKTVRERSYCYKTLGSTLGGGVANLYVRGYFYVSVSGIATARFHGASFRLIEFVARTLVGGKPRAQVVAWVLWDCNGPQDLHPPIWELHIRYGTGSYAYNVSGSWWHSPLTVNRWYCVELHWKKDAVNGMAELFVDGRRVCSLKGYDTSYWGNAKEVRVGLPELYCCGRAIVYCDCVKFSTSYIGREYY